MGGVTTALALEADLEAAAQERAREALDGARHLAAEYDVESAQGLPRFAAD